MTRKGLLFRVIVVVGFICLAAGLAFYLLRRSPPPPQATTESRDRAQADDIDRLYESSPITPNIALMNGGAVRFASFTANLPSNSGADNLARAEWFLKEYRGLLRLDDPATELQYIRTSLDGGTLWFQQLHEGIPVYSAQLNVRIEGTTVRQIVGGYLPNIDVSPEPTLTAREAETIALQAAGSKAQVIGDTLLRYFNVGLFGFDGQETHLAWLVHLTGSDSAALLIDTHSGKILYEEPGAVDEFDLDLQTGFQGTSDYCWNYTGDTWFNEDGVYTDFLGNKAKPDAEGYSANANIKFAYDWYNYLSSGGWGDSYTGEGTQIEMFIHVGGGVAQWKPGCQLMEFGEGQPVHDSVIHEYTHAVIGHSLGLVNGYEPGALAESLGDIMAQLEFAGRVGPPDWLLSEDASAVGDADGAGPCPPAIRNLANPPCSADQYGPHPDHMLANLSGNGVGYRQIAAGSADKNANDLGYVHGNASIHNKAAYLLTVGGQFKGYDMKGGLGAQKASILYTGVICCGGVSTSGFLHARDVMLSQATGYVNAKLPDWNYVDLCIITNAYAAVGVGVGDDPNCDGFKDGPPLPDIDLDGWTDANDNCPLVDNGSQANTDGEGEGDACDDDDDNDGKPDLQDNCPFIPNPNQEDTYGDKLGDACADSDGDTWIDDNDNCPDVYNPGQKNTDAASKDLQGDACDDDDDNDHIPDLQDNCPTKYNPGQANWNGGTGDLVGDVCQDFDGDEEQDDKDNCPGKPNKYQEDNDKDLIGDVCDPDIDGDGVNNDVDNAPEVVNPDQKDDDQDNVGNVIDKCPGVKDPDNSDYDGDGLGSPCDEDDDGDLVLDAEDNCPILYNPQQHDANEDGVGTGCDWKEELALAQLGSTFSFTPQDIPVLLEINKYTILDLPPPIPQDRTRLDDMRVLVMVTLDTRFNMGIMDSNGRMVAKGQSDRATQFLSFAPAANAARNSGKTASASESGAAPNRTRYFVVLFPAKGTDLKVSHKVHVEMRSGVSSRRSEDSLPTRTSLPYFTTRRVLQ